MPASRSRIRLRATPAIGAALLSVAAGVTALHAGPYPGLPGTPGSDAVANDDPAFVAWATGVAQLTRGPVRIDNLALGYAAFGTAESVLGPASAADAEDPYDVVSLGDGGAITLTFAQPITDGPGWDFAVFENGFVDSSLSDPDDLLALLELGFVEVSSDGVNFFRFPAVSLTPPAPVGTFGVLDPTLLHNLAGKHLLGYGTPFDLAALADVSPLLDVTAITHVRVIDVVGTTNPAHARHDSLGQIIVDPFPTPFTTGGFDLDAVGVRHEAPPPDYPWTTWRAQQFSAAQLLDPAISGQTADPDGDGRPNLHEYAEQTLALTADVAAAPVIVATIGEHLQLTYVQPAGRTDLSYVVEWSTNLTTWTSGAGVTTTVATESVAGGTRVTVRAVATTAAAARQFLRLRIALP